MLTETDVMTSSGWKNIKDISQDDYIACLIENNVEFHNFTSFHKENDRCDILLFQSTQLYLETTSDHNLWVRIQKGPQKFHKSERFLNVKTDVYFKKIFPWNLGKELEHVIIPEFVWTRKYVSSVHTYKIPPLVISANIFLDFLGWVLSDGGVTDYQINITQTKHIDRVRKCLESLGMKFAERPHYGQYAKNFNARRFVISSKQFACFIKDIFEKGIPSEIKNSSKEQIAILLNSFFYGNGDFHGRRKLYVRLNKKLADDLQELVLKLGFSSNAYRVGNMYVITIGRDYVHTLETIRQPVKQIFDSRDVFMCDVPGNLIFVRKNGKCCWVGSK